MLSSPDLSFCQTLNSSEFNQLGKLLEQMISQSENAAFVMTEAVLARIPAPGNWHMQQFTVVVSSGFSGLLIGLPLYPSADANFDDFPVNTKLTFEPDEIIKFLENLRDVFESDSHTYKTIEEYCQIPALNNAVLQSQFTVLLLKHLTIEKTQSNVSNSTHKTNSCEHVEISLHKQIIQEKLLNQVITQTRKSLDLS
ncbi:MAG: sensor histidine kinase, partial [Cyanobacteria bacterium J06628_3]